MDSLIVIYTIVASDKCLIFVKHVILYISGKRNGLRKLIARKKNVEMKKRSGATNIFSHKAVLLFHIMTPIVSQIKF